MDMNSSSLRRVLVLALLSGLLVAAAPWPGWRGPNRDGKSADTGLLKQWPDGGPTLLWKATGLGQGFSTVSIANGTIFASGDRDNSLHLYAFDPAGKLKWKSEVGTSWVNNYPGSRSTPMWNDGRVYIISGGGTLACFNDSDGKLVWSKKFSDFGGQTPHWGYAESVLIHKDHAIVTPGGKNCIVALNKLTGDVVWKSEGFDAGAQYGSCIAFTHEGTDMIAAGTHGGLFCVDAGTGKKLWSNNFSQRNTANCPTPVYSDGYVFWSTGYGKGGICMKLNGKTAEVAWQTRDMVCHHGGFIIHEGYIYGNHEGGWSCLELKTGKKQWNDKGVGKGSLCYADGMLYLFAESGGNAALASL
jgi:outer membrane protein assembly factor BamB